MHFFLGIKIAVLPKIILPTNSQIQQSKSRFLANKYVFFLRERFICSAFDYLRPWPIFHQIVFLFSANK